jgi:hypothetical protein
MSTGGNKALALVEGRLEMAACGGDSLAAPTRCKVPLEVDQILWQNKFRAAGT